MVPAKTTHATQASKASMESGTSVPLRAMVTVVSKTVTTVVVTVTTSRTGVLKISTATKRPAVALSLVVKREIGEG
jgi:hypothetical protein